MFFTYGLKVFRKESSNIIPIKTIHGLPTIDVNVQGHTLQLILDIGAHFSGLIKETIKTIPLKGTPEITNSTNVFGEKFTRRVFYASKVSIGNYLLPYLEFNELTDFNEDFGDLESKAVIYGHIGREPFLDKVLFIDRRKQICVVKQAYLNQKTDLEKYYPGKWIEADFALDKGSGIILNLDIDSQKRKAFILDTGSNVSVIDKNYSSKEPFSLNSKKEEMSFTLSNGTSLGKLPFYFLDSSKVGLQGILGFDFFDHYMVCLDFLNKKVYLKKYD